tara:strand:- start:7249 stop:7764 length:516 start_codon:yes stop_codon:yes gene_type:complete
LEYECNNPWHHLIIDDLYDTDTIKNELIAYIKANPFYVSQKTMNIFNFDKIPLTKKLSTSVNLLNYLDKFKHRKVKNPVVETDISINLPNHEYRIHDEIKRKILSFVTYIHPVKSHGTLLYDKNKNFVKEIEWKPKRTMVFAGETGQTWHNFKSGNHIRITMNSFIVEQNV